MNRLALLLILVILLTGCAPEAQLTKVEERLKALETKVTAHQTAIDSVTRIANTDSGRITGLTFRLDNLLSGTGVLSPDDTGFTPVATQYGTLLVSLENVQPYANGYRLTVNFGNPLNVDLVGVSFKIRWGKPMPEDGEQLTAWSDAVREKDTKTTNTIKKGSWNPTQVTVTPATAEEIGYIEISAITAENVALLSK